MASPREIPKSQIFLTILFMLIVIGCAAYFNTFESDGGQARTFIFPTSTPTADLVGSGWWDAMPTPRSVKKLRP